MGLDYTPVNTFRSTNGNNAIMHQVNHTKYELNTHISRYTSCIIQICPVHDKHYINYNRENNNRGML